MIFSCEQILEKPLQDNWRFLVKKYIVLNFKIILNADGPLVLYKFLNEKWRCVSLKYPDLLWFLPLQIKIGIGIGLSRKTLNTEGQFYKLKNFLVKASNEKLKKQEKFLIICEFLHSQEKTVMDDWLNWLWSVVLGSVENRINVES